MQPNTKKLNKPGRTKIRGGARPRAAYSQIKKQKDGQKAVIQALIKFRGGITRIAKESGDILGEPEFPIQNFVNWRNRKGIPLEYVFRLAEGFNISPYLLNYVGTTQVHGKGPAWSVLIRSCDFIPIAEHDRILSYRHPGE